jgi:N-methylhydantoinase A
MSREAQGLRIGVDIGGTFTDLVFLRPDGRLDRRKVPSTPDDYSRAIVESVGAWLEEAGDGAITEVVHATTVATNAILERKGAKTALVTTEGFRDVLELRRIRSRSPTTSPGRSRRPWSSARCASRSRSASTTTARS